MAQPAPDLAARASAYLAAQEAAIVFRWTQRVSRLRSDAGQPGMPRLALRHRMPEIVAPWRRRLCADLTASRTALAQTGLPQVHAATCPHHRVPAGVVVQQRAALRRDRWDVLRQWCADPPLTVEGVFRRKARITGRAAPAGGALLVTDVLMPGPDGWQVPSAGTGSTRGRRARRAPI